jgi:uncharacterized protein YjiS (DUF1127 family)
MSTTFRLSVSQVLAPIAGTIPHASHRHVTRRLRALIRLFARRRRAQRRYDDLRHLDERTLRDLGVARSELASVVAELDGRAALTRRRTEFETWSATSSLRVRAVDSSL